MNPTHILVPIELWKETINLLEREVKIGPGAMVWLNLSQCQAAPPQEKKGPNKP